MSRTAWLRLGLCAALPLALSGCLTNGVPTGDLGRPLPPTATSPTGSVDGGANGGGVPLPFMPGGCGGVGGGGPPAVGGWWRGGSASGRI